MIAERLLATLSILVISVLAAAVVIAVLLRVMRPYLAAQPAAPFHGLSDGAVFQFEGARLTDASPRARQMLTRLRIDHAELGSLTAHLARTFPSLADRIDAMRQGRTERMSVTLVASDKTETLQLDMAHGILRLALSGHGTDATALPVDSIDGVQQDLAILRCIAEDAPQLIWQVDANQQVNWANRAYLDLADRLVPRAAGDDPVWPGRPIISDLRPVGDDGLTQVQRVPLMLPDLTEPQWFEVTSVRRGDATVHFAVDASRIIQAETGRNKFIQTLTKTFAHLSVGLAIFDKERRLVLFNPALLDLTGLPVGFLSGRPQVNSVLDRLRDMNMLPEPKNYQSWRDQMAALEAAAVKGTYCETWSLPSGQTYRVTGKPHPDGAIAFLFEDITTEILLTRSFRSELETAQAVIDSLDEGIAVFSQAGTLTMCNALYAEIWGRGVIGLADIGIHDEIDLWKSRTAPSAIWDRLQQSVAVMGDRQRWQDRIRLTDGRVLNCRFTPLTGGATLIGFRPQGEEGIFVSAARGEALGKIKSRMPTRPRVVAEV